MAGLNRVQLIGRLGMDPETRETPNGRQVSTFRMAVDRRWRDSAGEPRENTEWVNVEAWARMAEISAQYLRKGRLIYLEGRLQTDRYEKDGSTRYFTKVIASSIQMLDGPTDEVEGDAAEQEAIA